MKKQLFYLFLALIIFSSCKKEDSASLTTQEVSSKKISKTKSLVPVTLSTNTWLGNYLQVQFESSEHGLIIWYPTKDYYGSYGTFMVPAGTYNHVYILTEEAENGPYYMSFITNGSDNSRPCVTVSDEWIDSGSITIDGSNRNEFRIADYCDTNY